MKKFRTRLFHLDDNLPPEWGAWGLGWNIRQRHFQLRFPLDDIKRLETVPEHHHHMRAIVGSSFEKGGYLCSKLAPELIIEAKDFDNAQRVMGLIGAGSSPTCICLMKMPSKFQRQPIQYFTRSMPWQ